MLRRAAVRASLILFCAACAGSMRPAVIPKLSELPVEPERRNAILDSAHAEPGPENRPVSKKARKAETYAATAAALLGHMFSKTENVTLGGAAAIDENLLFEDAPKHKQGQGAKTGDSEPAKGDTPAADEDREPGTLVPWVRIEHRDGQ
jgi:hypothetical protein